MKKRITFQMFSTALGTAAVGLSRGATSKGYKLVKKVDPPANPASRRTAWTSALGWAAITGAAAAMSGVIGRRVAAGLWHKRVGRLPRGTR